MSDTGIEKSVALFVSHLEANARSARYIRGTKSQLVRIPEDCNVHYFSDIHRADVEAFLNWLRNQGLGART